MPNKPENKGDTAKEWIELRYGDISISRVFMACVLVDGEPQVGMGGSEALAIRSLQRKLARKRSAVSKDPS